MYKNILDSINGDTWLSSDHHFGHNKIIEFEPERKKRALELGYPDWETMLIEEHNKLVHPEDTMLLLGDFAFKNIQRFKDALNGNKILVLGNHDHKGPNVYGDITVVRGLIIDHYGYALHNEQPDQLFSGIIKKVDNETIMFSHYALYNDCNYDNRNEKIRPRMDILEDFYDSFDCNLNIHGHLHSKQSNFLNSMSVCVEQTDYKPVQLKTLITYISN